MKTLFSMLALTVILTSKAFAYGVGQTYYALEDHATLLSTELLGIVSDDGGMGMQARATHRLPNKLTLELGGGINGGDRKNRVFVGGDYEFVQDFMNRPRLSAKLNYENAKEFDQRTHNFLLTPTVSKLFIVADQEVTPFVGAPLGVRLRKDNRYETFVNANVGISSQIPGDTFKNLTLGIEGQIEVKDSFTQVMASLAYKI